MFGIRFILVNDFSIFPKCPERFSGRGIVVGKSSFEVIYRFGLFDKHVINHLQLIFDVFDLSQFPNFLSDIKYYQVICQLTFPRRICTQEIDDNFELKCLTYILLASDAEALQISPWMTCILRYADQHDPFVQRLPPSSPNK